MVVYSDIECCYRLFYMPEIQIVTFGSRDRKRVKKKMNPFIIRDEMKVERRNGTQPLCPKLNFFV